MEKQKRMIAIGILCMGFWVLISPAWAQQQEANPLDRMEIPSSPNPVGSGARAIGMGGAFIAIADDATAASWNPGGLIQLEYPEISFVLGGTYRKEENTFGSGFNISDPGSGAVDDYNLNYLSAAYPFTVKGYNMIVSLNYQHLYNFNRDWDLTLNPTSPDDDPIQYNYEQDGALYALGLAYSIQITPDLSAGITVNYWGDFLFENEWEQKFYQKESTTVTDILTDTVVDQKEQFSFQGWNANFGFLWRISQNWTLGGVFKAPFTADVDHALTTDYQIIHPTEPDNNSQIVKTETYGEELTMPMSYGMGLAYHFSDNCWIGGDIYRTHWDDFEYEDRDGNKTSPISGKDAGDSDVDPTTWFRLGAEYLIHGKKTIVPLRAGLFYDPAPAQGSPDDYYGISLGTGFVYMPYKRYIFDIAYQYRFGDDVGSMFQGSDFSQDVREHTVYTSLIIHF